MSKQRVTSDGPDPIDSTDLQQLRMEILRLRDLDLGLESHAQVLANRVVELETQNDELDRAIAELSRAAETRVEELNGVINELNGVVNELNEVNQALHVELGRNPVIRIARAVARRLKLR